MQRYPIEPRTRKYIKGYRFLSFAWKYKKKIHGYRTRFYKTASKKVAHKAGEFLRNKTADAVTKSNDDKI